MAVFNLLVLFGVCLLGETMEVGIPCWVSCINLTEYTDCKLMPSNSRIFPPNALNLSIESFSVSIRINVDKPLPYVTKEVIKQIVLY